MINWYPSGKHEPQLLCGGQLLLDTGEVIAGGYAMGQSKSGKCKYCQESLPAKAVGGGKLVYCPNCGKALDKAASDHMKSMERIDGGFILSLGDDPIAATPVSPDQKTRKHQADKTKSKTKPLTATPAKKSGDGESHTPTSKKHSKPHRHEHGKHAQDAKHNPSKSSDSLPLIAAESGNTQKPPTSSKPATDPSNDDTADLLSLDLDLVAAEEAQQVKPDKPEKSEPDLSRLKHIAQPMSKSPAKPQPSQKQSEKISKPPVEKSDDDLVLRLLDEPVVATPRRKPTPAANPMQDTLAGLSNEEDQLDLAQAEEVVELKVDQDDDDEDVDINALGALASGLVVTDVVDEDQFDTEIKPEESVPVVGLNMLQEHVGKAHSWDRVPLPELAASDQSSVYELAVEPEVAAGKVCPDCGAQMPYDAVVCATCGYSIQLGRHVAGVSGDPMGDRYDGSERYVSESEKYEADQEYYHQQHLIQDVYVPTVVLLSMLVFLVFTVVAICPYEMVSRDIVEAVIPSKMPAVPVAPMPGAATNLNGPFGGPLIAPAGTPIQMPDLTTQQKWFCIAYLFGTNLLEIAIKIPFMFIGMLVVAKLFGVAFGGIFSTMTKILAIAMTAHVLSYFIEALMFILTEGISVLGFEWYVSFPFAFISFIGLNIKFFDLDVMEAFVLFLVSYLMPFFASILVMLWIVAMLT